jgi:branched-chain amino acid transport system ATP-binding protein
MLGGQLRPDAGRVRLAGHDITGCAPRKVWRLGVGRTFQVTATFGSMTVLENVQMALLSYHRRLGGLWVPVARQDRAQAEALLARFGMADQADRPCGILAYGDLKRVELAIALANEPKLLLMDEPTAGMAPAERKALMVLTASIARERGIAVLFTEHDMDVVFGHADRVLVLDRGAAIAEGPPEAVRGDSRVREVYLGAEEV